MWRDTENCANLERLCKDSLKFGMEVEAGGLKVDSWFYSTYMHNEVIIRMTLNEASSRMHKSPGIHFRNY